jgi:phosphoribosylaminoimidazole-succinocarboxamide synthase
MAFLQEEKTAEHTMLSTSVKRAEDDLTVARRKHQEYTKESSELQEKIAALALESDTTLRRYVTSHDRCSRDCKLADALSPFFSVLADSLERGMLSV